MARGRPRIDKKLNDLHGDPGKHQSRKSRATLPPSTGKLGMPKGLDVVVQRKCATFARYVEESGAPIDLVRSTFERYCTHLQIWKNETVAYKKAEKPGEKAAAFQRYRDADTMALKCEKRITDIIKISDAPTQDKETALEKFFKKGGKLGVVK